MKKIHLTAFIVFCFLIWIIVSILLVKEFLLYFYVDPKNYIDLAKQQIKNTTIYKDNVWHCLDIKDNVKLMYCSNSNKETIFFVIDYKNNQDYSILSFGKEVDDIPLGDSGFLEGQRIISGFGIVHSISISNNVLKFYPPITNDEISTNFIVINDREATIDKFYSYQ